jgi:nucleotide-binding universal stress UspA family protein
MTFCIVCGVDDSSGARKAARVADELADGLGARLVLVHGAPVAPSVMYGVPFDSDAFQREVMQEGRQQLEDVANTCGAAQVSQRAEFGSPIEVLVRALKEERADPLVVGNPGPGRDAVGAAGQRRS